MDGALIECVPNFSEGRDQAVIEVIAAAIRSVAGVKLLHIDPNADANRTVMTFAGSPEAVVEAAFLAMQVAAERIDMSMHRGAHPRMGATDVCPLVPLANISMEETVGYAQQLAERVGRELEVPVYLYEYAASTEQRKNLARVRAGEYEGLFTKMTHPAWKPDYGPKILNTRSGATAIGARDFLIAFNVNLSTESTEIARKIAGDLRESGRPKRVNGQLVRDTDGTVLRIPGRCKGVKAIGWFMEGYGMAQVSMNITNIDRTPVHQAYEACRELAAQHDVELRGTELIGMAPLRVFLEAGNYYAKDASSHSEADLLRLAISRMGLDSLHPFDPEKKIIEYRMKKL